MLLKNDYLGYFELISILEYMLR